jgi:hypothetical protein
MPSRANGESTVCLRGMSLMAELDPLENRFVSKGQLIRSSERRS